jgi:hypothetical protein
MEICTARSGESMKKLNRARLRGVPYQSLIKMWLAEKVG